jgi:hypothetical protein
VIWQGAESMWQGRSTVSRDPARLFLSYSRKDRRKVQAFRRGLEKAGCSVWLDETDIVVGDPILDKISTAISGGTDFVVLFLSESSIDSEWVKLETRLAYERELGSGQPFLLPVRLTDCVVPAHLSVKKYADAFGRTAQCITEIQDAVRTHIINRPYF